MTTSAPVLQVDSISLAFGGQKVLDDINLTAKAGEMIALIGPNGSGKTSLCNVLSGAYKPATGTIRLEGRDITGLSQHGFGRLSISRTFQHAILVDDLSAGENVALGIKNIPTPLSLARALLMDPLARRTEGRIAETAWAIASSLGVDAYWNAPAGSLSNRQRRLVELARCLVSQPRLVLIDELAAGLTQEDKRNLSEAITHLRGEHLTQSVILIIEHDVDFVRRLCPRTVVLDRGRVLADGLTSEVLALSDVRSAYLGTV